MGVKNKYYTPCSRALGVGEDPKQNTCYKNCGLGQSSSSMEPAIIADGFLRSEEMLGLRSARLTADGDSSVYKQILESRPYNCTTVQQIECENHLLRNFCSKLRQIAATSNKTKCTVHLRKNKRKYSKVQDGCYEGNVRSHVFGEHKQCKERGYFCELQPESGTSKSNLVPELISAGLYQQIIEVVGTSAATAVVLKLM